MAGWTPEDVVRFETGNQSVRDVSHHGTQEPLCETHTHYMAGLAGASDQIGYQTGLTDETTPGSFAIRSRPYAGQCAECRRRQQGTPWQRQTGQRPQMAEMQPTPPAQVRHVTNPGRWPYRPLREHERSIPMRPQLPPTMSARHAASAEDIHPHEEWQKRNFGCYHVSNGRRLPTHYAGLLSREDQDRRLSDYPRWDVHSSFEPDPNMIAGARAYNHQLHLPDPHAQSYSHVVTHVGDIRDIGRAYDALPEHDPHAVPHFEAMRDEVNHQYHHLTHRMGINVESVNYDPYRNVHEMVHDVRHNRRMRVLSTETTGGHPFFSNEDNDKFRAVHDAFGHAATGRSFDANGEEAAFLAHSRMFSAQARPAMTSETRGQNASLHLNGDFGPQRVAVLPRHMQEMATDLRPFSRPAARVAIKLDMDDIDLTEASPMRAIAHFVARDEPRIIRLAHDSGDQSIVFHCFSCGSGQVIARSDGTINCEFCGVTFTVQLQPEFSAFPQTIDGQPVDIPGMGPQDVPQNPALQQGPPEDDEEDPNAVAPGGAEGAGQEQGDPDAVNQPVDENSNPIFNKKSYRTASGQLLDEDHYIQHLALQVTSKRTALLARIRRDNRVA